MVSAQLMLSFPFAPSPPIKTFVCNSTPSISPICLSHLSYTTLYFTLSLTALSLFCFFFCYCHLISCYQSIYPPLSSFFSSVLTFSHPPPAIKAVFLFVFSSLDASIKHPSVLLFRAIQCVPVLYDLLSATCMPHFLFSTLPSLCFPPHLLLSSVSGSGFVYFSGCEFHSLLYKIVLQLESVSFHKIRPIFYSIYGHYSNTEYCN